MKKLLTCSPLGRIAHVTTAHPSRDNRIFRKECVGLALAGFDVHLIAVAEEDTTIANVKVIALPKRRSRISRILLGPWDAWKELRHLAPDMIHVHDPELIPLALIWRVVYGRPGIFDAHEDLPKQVLGKAYLPTRARPVVALLARGLERLADQWLDAVVAATPAIARNFNRAPVTLVQNFPWLRDFGSPSAPEQNLGLTLSYVGGITRERGAVEMITAVKQSSWSPRLVLAGQADADASNAIMADTSGRIEFRGAVPAEDIPRIIADSHAGLVLLHPLPNYLESQPTKLFEYMASGRPFIASNFPFWIDLLDKFRCGFFLDPLNVAELEGLIDWLHHHPKEAEAMGERGRLALVANFTFESESDRLVEMTASLLTRDNRQDFHRPLDRPTTAASGLS